VAAHATLLESCADDLETVLRERELEALTLKEASQESGYSYSALQKMVANNTLANVGDAYRPRVRRGDLPRKPGQLLRPDADSEPDLVGRILGSG
jgi:hypothetical protein